MAKTSCKGASETLRIFAVAGCLAAMTARAETYYLKQNANTISPFTSANIGSYWRSAHRRTCSGWTEDGASASTTRRCSPERRYISARLTARRPARSICEM